MPGDFSGPFNITGSHLQLILNAAGYLNGTSVPPPTDTEYYVSLNLMQLAAEWKAVREVVAADFFGVAGIDGGADGAQ